MKSLGVFAIVPLNQYLEEKLADPHLNMVLPLYAYTLDGWRPHRLIRRPVFCMSPVLTFGSSHLLGIDLTGLFGFYFFLTGNIRFYKLNEYSFSISANLNESSLRILTVSHSTLDGK